MGYECQNFKNGQVLTAECLNRMDQGIKDACDSVPPACDKKDCSKILSHGENGHEWIDYPVDTEGAAAGDKAWSSKIIVERLCPEFSMSGNLVHCNPVEGSEITVNSVLVHGIHEITVCGKNLYNMKAFPITDGKYIVPAGGTTPSSGYACIEGFMPVTHLRGKTITLNHPPTETGGNTPRMVFYTEENDKSSIDEGRTNGYTTTVPNTANYMRFSVPNAYASGEQIQIELGDKVTEYEPYMGTTESDPVLPVKIPAVKGTNTVFCIDYRDDIDIELVNITVTGRADPIVLINSLMSRVAELEEVAVGNT